jgi:hypothetical protein
VLSEYSEKLFKEIFFEAVKDNPGSTNKENDAVKMDIESKSNMQRCY